MNRPLHYFFSTGLSVENSPHVSERWKANLVALSRSVVGQTFMVNQLVDMEWKFGVTAGSRLKSCGADFFAVKDGCRSWWHTGRCLHGIDSASVLLILA